MKLRVSLAQHVGCGGVEVHADLSRLVISWHVAVAIRLSFIYHLYIYIFCTLYMFIQNILLIYIRGLSQQYH